MRLSGLLVASAVAAAGLLAHADQYVWIPGLTRGLDSQVENWGVGNSEKDYTACDSQNLATTPTGTGRFVLVLFR